MFNNKMGSRRFTYFKSFDNFFEEIKEIEVKKRYYAFEIVMEKCKRKPYLDLEKIYPNKKTFKKHYNPVIKKLQKDIISIFKTEYNEEITVEDILLLDSSGQTEKGYKISLHIIVSPVDRTFYYVDSKLTTSSSYHFYTSLINLDPDYKEFLDPNVYSSNFNFRIIGSYKTLNDDRALKPIDTKTFKEIDTDDNEKLRYLLTYIEKENKKLITPLIDQTTKPKQMIKDKQTKKDKQTIDSIMPAKTDPTELLLSLVRKYHPTAELNKLYYGKFYNFTYKDRKEVCPIGKKTHKKNGFSVYETTKGYYMKCFSGKCIGRKYIGPADHVDECIKNAHQINQQYLIMGGNIDDEPEEKVNELSIKWLESLIKMLAIKSPMGTGKTAMIKKILKYDKTLKKILWITHRQTLTEQISGNLKR